MEMFTFAADGTFAGRQGPDVSRFPVASRAFVFPGESLVADGAGVVYRTSDLAFVGSLGAAIGDLAFFGDGTPVLLRDRVVTTVRTDNFVEVGRAALARLGLRLFARNDIAYVFGAPETPAGRPGLVRISRAESFPQCRPRRRIRRARASRSTTRSLGEDGIVHVFSRSQQALLRWSPVSKSFLPSVPLRAAPRTVFHQPGGRRALIYYPDGSVSEVPLRAGNVQERVLGAVSTARITGLLDLGDLAVVAMPYGQNSDTYGVAFDSGVVPRAVLTPAYAATGATWVPSTRRVYQHFSSGTYYQAIAANGAAATGPRQLRVQRQPALSPPLRFTPYGSLYATANGRVVTANLVAVGTLANNILDATWLPQALCTIREVSGERRSSVVAHDVSANWIAARARRAGAGAPPFGHAAGGRRHVGWVSLCSRS